jgi:hypothetical protein
MPSIPDEAFLKIVLLTRYIKPANINKVVMTTTEIDPVDTLKKGKGESNRIAEPSINDTIPPIVNNP